MALTFDLLTLTLSQTLFVVCPTCLAVLSTLRLSVAELSTSLWTYDGFTENAGHEFAIYDKYRMKNILRYSTVCISFTFLIFCMYGQYGECVNVENLTAPAHHKI